MSLVCPFGTLNVIMDYATEREPSYIFQIPPTQLMAHLQFYSSTLCLAQKKKKKKKENVMVTINFIIKDL